MLHMLKEARGYLHANGELRQAVGAQGDETLDARWLGAGEHNANFAFEVGSGKSRYVLRVNVIPQPFHDNQVAYEFAALSTLASSGCVPEPVYIDDSDTALGNGVLVIGFCEGDELDFDHLRPGDLRCAAQLMADVHAVPVTEPTALHRPCDPLRELFEECVARFDIYRRSVAEQDRITHWARRFIEAAARAIEAAPPKSQSAHIVNTETLPSHFLISSASAAEAAAASGSGRFCTRPGSFIDWERPIIGEVAQDVAYFVSPTTTFWDSDFLFPPEDVDAFVQDYWQAVDGRFERENFDERFRAYRAMTALRSVTWCCRALALGHNRAATAGKLPVYLSDDFMEMLADQCFCL